MLQLTEEGRRYIRDGLPEKRLIALVKKPTPLAGLQMPDLGIALQWAKKHGWVAIEKGMLRPLGKPRDLPEEAGLQAVAAGKPVDARIAAVLIQRKLVQEARDDLRRQAERQLEEGVATLTPELIATGLWKQATFKPYNVSSPGAARHPGKRHPYNAFLFQVRQRLVEMGFKEMTGPLIELEFWNFDALFQPQNHPSRDWTQTYSLAFPTTGRLPAKKLTDQVKAAHEGRLPGSTGWGYRWNPEKAARLMPRAHDTAISPRYLATGVEVPGKYFNIVRCFRPDVIDATHGVEFNQTGGFVIDPDLTFRHLLGLLKEFATEFAGAEKIKFIPDYYPFTEPSIQMSAKHPDLGWIEFGGAGIFREELTQALGVQEPVIAWGVGIDRLAMFRLGIRDIRELFTRDLQWLRSQPVIA
ncbi:MAG: phenylalanine--tRNA ligase subunit alpha [Candidatus Aenigmarchaeota archaeon]|nr:phenylalanine--tRNA ligase subunit alpha [Candidatus Aenigmarchaeota archaeon]